MFEKIKLRIIKGRQLKPFMVAKVLQEHEDRLKALENGSGSEQSEQQGGSQEQQGSSQEQQQEQTPTSRSVSFTINDGTDAINEASVVIDNDSDNSKTTGSAGGCTATLTDGEHTVVVSKEGYTTKTETISVDETHTSFTISLVAASSP